MPLIVPAAAEAGIPLSKGTSKETGDPKISYSFSASLDVGFTLVSDLVTPKSASSFELVDLIGINDTTPAAASFKVILNGKDDSKDWTVTYDYLGKIKVTVDKVKYTVKASDVIFTYNGKTNLKATTKTGPQDLGDFTIKETTGDKTLPLWSVGSLIPASYSDTTTNTSTGKPVTTKAVNLDFNLVSAPEPSSLVVVALVGCSLTGVGLLRRRRRVA